MEEEYLATLTNEQAYIYFQRLHDVLADMRFEGVEIEHELADLRAREKKFWKVRKNVNP